MTGITLAMSIAEMNRQCGVGQTDWRKIKRQIDEQDKLDWRKIAERKKLVKKLVVK